MLRELMSPIAIACLIGSLIVLTYSFAQVTRSGEYIVCEVPSDSDRYQDLQFHMFDQSETIKVKTFTTVELVVDVVFIAMAWCGALYLVLRIPQWYKARVSKWKYTD